MHEYLVVHGLFPPYEATNTSIPFADINYSTELGAVVFKAKLS
jgi:hypothetical protein